MRPNKELVSFSVLEETSSLLNLLQEMFSISKSQLKKMGQRKDCRWPAKKVCDLSLNIANYLKINPEFESPDLSILYEDDTFIALEKPIRLHCHPLSYLETDNVLSFLAKKYPAFLMVNTGKFDRGLLYRLDYETSGVLFFVKNEDALKQLRSGFSQVQKFYFAIVHGQLKGQGSLRHWMKASGVKGHKMVEGDKGDFDASLSYQSLGYNEEQDLSLVGIQLESGHRHQIRFQLSQLGHAILGDDLYGGVSAERLYLHACCYTFTFQGKLIYAQSDSPDLFGSFFDMHRAFEVLSNKWPVI